MTKNEDEDFQYSRSESIGLTYLNKFAINEEHQNEITGVYFIKPWVLNSEFDEKVIQEALQHCHSPPIPDLRNNLHFIFACYTTDDDQSKIIDAVKEEMTRKKIKRANITFIEMIRAYCITKEKCKKFYTSTELTDEKLYIRGTITKELVESFGNDLDKFLEQPQKESFINTFTIPMLTHDEEQKLKNQCEDFNETFWKYWSQSLNPGKKNVKIHSCIKQYVQYGMNYTV